MRARARARARNQRGAGDGRGAAGDDSLAAAAARQLGGEGGAAAAAASVRGGGSGSGDEAEGDYGPGGNAPWPRSFRPVLSATPTPSVGAQAGPAGAPAPPLFWNLRGCTCREDWDSPAGAAHRAAGGSLCSCGGVSCAAHVDPPFLTEAEGQDVCSLRRHTGYGCTAGCTAEGKVNWFGFSCSRDGNGGSGDRACPPLVVTPSPTPSNSPTPPPPIVVPVVSWDPAAVVDLHGVRCEFLDGVERCFNEDTQGRTLCPPYVTSAYLRSPPTSGEGAVSADIASLCVEPRHAAQYYCSVFCQDGNSRVQWWTHDVNWCYSAEGKGACPPRHKVVPKEDFVVGPWSEVPPPETPCQAAFRAGVRPRPGPIEGLTVGMLTHEPVAFARTLETYDRRGLFPMLKEFLVYMNQRSEGLEAVLRPYRDKYGHDKIKVLGDATNVGIARGITYLTGNASEPCESEPHARTGSLPASAAAGAGADGGCPLSNSAALTAKPPFPTLPCAPARPPVHPRPRPAAAQTSCCWSAISG